MDTNKQAGLTKGGRWNEMSTIGKREFLRHIVCARILLICLAHVGAVCISTGVQDLTEQWWTGNKAAP